MSEEQAAATPEPTPPATEAPASATPATQAPAPPDWSTALDTLPADEIRKHRRFAGILGETLARERETWKRDQQAEDQRKTADQTLERLRSQARSDPVGFAEEWLKDDQVKLYQGQLEGVRGSLRQDFARRLGESFRGLPEWADMTQDEHAKLIQAVTGKSDDEVLTAFTAAAADLVAERRSAKRFEEWKKKELDREREAVRKEEAAKLLAKTPGADISRGRATSDKVDVNAMSDKEFDEYWDKRFKV